MFPLHVFVPTQKMAPLVGHQLALVPGLHQDFLPWPSYLAGHPSHTESQKLQHLKLQLCLATFFLAGNLGFAFSFWLGFAFWGLVVDLGA